MPAKRSRRPPLPTLVRRWSAVVVIATVGYFYYHPLHAYFSTRSELGATRTEADGGVDRWRRAARNDAALAASLTRANDEQRALRPEVDAGIAGARGAGGSLKCLHAHVAFALARPGYELGERILQELGPLWP